LDEIEKQLLKELSLFPDVVETSARDLKPNLIANYLYTLSSTYNKFYIQCPVLTAEKKVRDRRLLMVYSVKQVIKTGLSLIGIEAPEWM
jgi:arginyl-tRNA synthetase